MSELELNLNLDIPLKFAEIFEGEARYRGAYGGRGSAKSITFARQLLVRGAQEPMTILCARELQNSLKDSVHAELCEQIDITGLGAFYEYGESFIRGKNGTEFIYKGLRHNYQSIKSTSGVKIAWVEEAEYVSEKSWSILLPTIRLPGSEIWLTWNPESKDSATKKRFVDNKPANARIIEVNWRDNIYFPAELNEERLNDQRRDPDGYQHVWEGQCTTRSDAQILNGKWVIEEFTPTAEWGNPYQGADWGFSADPTVLIKLWVYNNNLYIEHEALGYGVELNDIPALFDHVPDARRYSIKADSSRPETISYIKNKGFNIEACEKWSGSVEDGIAHLRGAYDKIVIHPRCVNTIKEARLYSYKIDRLTDEVLPDIIDKHNHCIDAIRYAVVPLMQRVRSFWDLKR